MVTFSMLTFDDDGVQSTLMSIDECRIAVEQGRFGPDTRVTVYFDQGNPVRGIASDEPALAHQFVKAVAKPAPDSPAPDEEAVPEAAAVEAEPAEPAAKEAAALTEPELKESVQPAPDPAASTQISKANQNKRNGAVGVSGWLIIGVVVLYAVITRISNLGSGGDNQIASDETSAMSAEAGAPALDSPRYFAAREIRIQAQARVPSSGEPLAILPRGTELKGTLVDGLDDPNKKWLEISDGDYAGRYVSFVNLSFSVPPELDTSRAGDYYLTRSTALLTAPNAQATPVSGKEALLPETALVSVKGAVNSDWAELDWQGGGVAYLNWADLSTSGTERAIIVANRCNSSIRFNLRWHDTHGWHLPDSRSWTWDPGMTNTLITEDEDVRTDSASIFFIELKPGDIQGSPVGDSAVILNDKPRNLKRAIPEVDEEGNFRITFC